MNDSRLSDWLNNQMMLNCIYHNHKENMAWVATAIFVSGSITLGFWLNSITECNEKWIASILYFIAAGLIMRFIIWQFKNRWIAKRRIDGLEKTVVNFPSQKEQDWTWDDTWDLPRFVVRNMPPETRMHFIFHSSEWMSYAIALLVIIVFYILILGG